MIELRENEPIRAGLDKVNGAIGIFLWTNPNRDGYVAQAALGQATLVCTTYPIRVDRNDHI